MKITVLTVGKIKETYWKLAIQEYSKRLSRYCKLEILEVADEKTPDGAGEALKSQIKQKEALRLLAKIPSDAYVIALAIEGRMWNSEEMAGKIEGFGVQGISDVVFLIGGSLGLADSVLERAEEKLSFSRMTFPHQMMRVILLEQIYRGYRIINHEPYHK